MPPCQLVFRGLGAAQEGKIPCNFSVVCLNSPQINRGANRARSAPHWGRAITSRRGEDIQGPRRDLLPLTWQADVGRQYSIANRTDRSPRSILTHHLGRL